ncbi:hypothetical protein [Lacticaseibacillus casei]|uniref:hypothetical protein n=1 Tax=Lacticaseibacillus casei TaxID=1582 RepID=UPI00141A6531|nr:hypothetical protein [Lacticaseibacillus casei]NIG84232.1 hypothetical protein [Lacticaseibacillus casei]
MTFAADFHGSPAFTVPKKTAGGLGALAKMPACNVQLLGAKRKNLAGFSSATSQFRVGYLEQTEVFQSTPPALRTRACSRAEMVVGRSDLLQSPGELMLGNGGIDLLLRKHAAGRSATLILIDVAIEISVLCPMIGGATHGAAPAAGQRLLA